MASSNYAQKYPRPIVGQPATLTIIDDPAQPAYGPSQLQSLYYLHWLKGQYQAMLQEATERDFRKDAP